MQKLLNKENSKKTVKNKKVKNTNSLTKLSILYYNTNMSQTIAIIQVVLAVAIIGLILMQNKGAGLSSTFGGGNEVYLTKRGIEKWVINATVILIATFVVLRIVAFY